MKTTMFAALAATMALAVPASAHVTVQPRQAEAGGFTRLAVRVPNERDNASTESVRVQFPPGFIFLSYEPVPGWDVDVKMRKLATPVESHGEEHTEEVGEVAFTARRGAEIRPGQFRDFGLSVAIPDRPGATLTFKALQRYTGGEVVRWIGPPDAEEPAAQVNVLPAAALGAAGAATARTPPADGDGPSTALVVAALALGALGTLAGGLGLATARRARAA